MRGDRELSDAEISWLIKKWDYEREIRTRLKKSFAPQQPTPFKPIAIVKETVTTGVYSVSTTSKWALSEKRELTKEGFERRTYGE
jgi:hypothetical protein